MCALMGVVSRVWMLFLVSCRSLVMSSEMKLVRPCLSVGVQCGLGIISEEGILGGAVFGPKKDRRLIERVKF